MFIPIRTEVESSRRAVVVPWLIGANVVVSFGLVLAIRSGLVGAERILDTLALDPVRPRVWQFVSYAFVHDLAGPWHLLANMLFLWVFGTAVEGRLGRGWFLLFYLVGGAVAGSAHLAVSSAPVIGASGAVAAVSGAFLALFPRAHIRVLIVFFMIGFVSIPAMWFIGFYFLVDLLSQTTAMLGANRGNVAYAAHLAGYAYGFAVAVLLLATRVLPRRDFDIFFLFTQARRRAAMRAATAESQRRNVVVRSGSDSPPKLPVAPPPLQPHAAERAEISRLHRSGDLSAAAATYRALLARDGKMVLAEDQQLDVANQLMHEGRHATAAAAYECFVERYPTSGRVDEIRLMLAMLYTRLLHDPAKAKERLASVRRTALEPGQRDFADQLREELPA